MIYRGYKVVKMIYRGYKVVNMIYRGYKVVKATGGCPRSLLICYRSRGDLEDVEDRIKKYCS